MFKSHRDQACIIFFYATVSVLVKEIAYLEQNMNLFKARFRGVMNKEAALGSSMMIIFSITSILAHTDVIQADSLVFDIAFNLSFFSLFFVPVFVLGVGGKIAFGLFGFDSAIASSKLAQAVFLAGTLAGGIFISPVLYLVTALPLGLALVMGTLKSWIIYVLGYMIFICGAVGLPFVMVGSTVLVAFLLYVFLEDATSPNNPEPFYELAPIHTKEDYLLEHRI